MTCIRMKKQVPPALSVLLLVAVSASLFAQAGLSARADAHSGGRVYPIAYLSDEMLEQIQLDDGRIDEWIELVGEPAMTLLDFSSQNDAFEALDPSDMDFRIWLGWHDDPDRLYVAFVSSDDVYTNNHDYEAIRGSLRDLIRIYDSITLAIDGDHSGGKGCPYNCQTEDWREVRSRTQRYEAISRTVSGPTLDDSSTRYATEEIAWTVLPPYGQGGGGVAGEAPTISVIEFYVTPFDHFASDDPDGSVVSDLAAGQVIGFAILVDDWDSFDRDNGDNSTWVPEAMNRGDADDRDHEIRAGWADFFLDGILLPAGAGPEDTAAESVSWGRIKASLME